MAICEYLLPIILLGEGGFVNDPDDRGGATNLGVTLATWKAHGYDKNSDGVIDVKDLKLLDYKDAFRILKNIYWNQCKADQIESQAIANTLVDAAYNKGRNGIKICQKLLGVIQDGIVGPITLSYLNKVDEKSFLERFYQGRRDYYYNLTVRNPSQRKFLNGWYNRINNLKNYNKIFLQ